jgi:hypothetical protein
MTLRVEGRSPLSGSYQPSGNANAAQALLAAALLTEAPVEPDEFRPRQHEGIGPGIDGEVDRPDVDRARKQRDGSVKV